MDDDLSIGLRGKGKARRHLLLPQYFMILNNPVTYQCKGITADMGVGIGLGWFSVGRPACMGDSCEAVESALTNRALQFDHLAHCS